MKVTAAQLNIETLLSHTPSLSVSVFLFFLNLSISAFFICFFPILNFILVILIILSSLDHLVL